MSEELKPCPFCGGEAYEYISMRLGEEDGIGCTDCGVLLLSMTAKAWNTRTDTQQVEQLRKERDELAAHVNMLRDALTISNTHHGYFGEEPWMTDSTAILALKETPAQSLQQHDNEVIDRVLNEIELVEGINNKIESAIRNLKHVPKDIGGEDVKD